MTTSTSLTPDPRKIQLLVLHGELSSIGPAVDNAERTEDLLGKEPRIVSVVATAAFGQAVKAAQSHNPDVILLDGVFGDPADLATELDEAMSDTPIVVVLDESQYDRAQACVLAGARACLTRPIDPATLSTTIFKVHERASRQRMLHAKQPGAQDIGRLIAVRGAKGGVGASVVATNLAIAIRRRTGQPTALVDGHFFGGDISVALDLKPARSLIDLVRQVNGLDEDMLRATLTEHPSGLAVLPAPLDFEDADAIHADEYQRVLDVLRMHYMYVIVDCSPAMDQNTLTALDMADVLLLVSTPEIAALRNAARVLELGARLGYSPAKMRLIMNRFDEPGALAPSDFEPYLAHSTSFRIPNDGKVIRALTRGEPLVMQRGSKAGKTLENLAKTVVDNAGWADEPNGSAGRGLLRFGLPRRSNPGSDISRLQPGAEAA
jgi:pilus assembly protein CpaE